MMLHGHTCCWLQLKPCLSKHGVRHGLQHSCPMEAKCPPSTRLTSASPQCLGHSSKTKVVHAQCAMSPDSKHACPLCCLPDIRHCTCQPFAQSQGDSNKQQPAVVLLSHCNLFNTAFGMRLLCESSVIRYWMSTEDCTLSVG